jgi:mannitol/fructose-specific phosphotransferase system IIA component (Ntr-type)
MIPSLVENATIVVELKSSTKDAAIKELLKAAQAAKIFPKKHEAAFAKKLLERESIGSTGLGNSVAVPHLKHDEVATSSVVVARAPGGIEWQAIDGRPVSILFFVASPSGDPESHLQCLRWISSLARNADFRRFLLDSEEVDQIRELLREMIAN